MIDLAALGWDAERESQFSPHRPDGLVPGRVAVQHRGAYDVLAEDGERRCEVVPRLVKEAASAADLPVVGDWVALDPDTRVIHALLPRRSSVSRRRAGESDVEQVLAANVDIALIVCGLDADFNVRRIERYLAICREGNVSPVVVLNKADECEDVAGALDEARRVAGAAGVLAISARTGFGCDAVGALLAPGVTAALLGSSGAGKSTLLNRILGADVQKTAAVRESDSRGRHTTTRRSLVVLANGGALIDTPGLREIQLWVTGESVGSGFDDIAALSAECRFGDCTHTVEPGCAVRGSVDAGRLESFHKMRREAERVSGLVTEKQRWRSAHKAARQLYKLRGK